MSKQTRIDKSRILTFLEKAGGALTRLEIRTDLGMTKAQVQRAVQELEAEGHVQRQGSAAPLRFRARSARQASPVYRSKPQPSARVVESARSIPKTRQQVQRPVTSPPSPSRESKASECFGISPIAPGAWSLPQGWKEARLEGSTRRVRDAFPNLIARKLSHGHYRTQERAPEPAKVTAVKGVNESRREPVRVSSRLARVVPSEPEPKARVNPGEETDRFGWNAKKARYLCGRLKQERRLKLLRVLDHLSHHPDRRFDVVDILALTGLGNTGALGQHLKHMTRIGKEIRIDPKQTGSWYLSWSKPTTSAPWRYWLTAERAAWWRDA
jgi:hypothetical protein